MSESRQADLRSYLGIFWRWKWIFLACLIVLPPAAFLLSARGQKSYQASALMQVQPEAVDTTLFQSFTALTTEESVNAAARLVATSAVARVAVRNLKDPPRDPRSLLGDIQVAPDASAGFITITATAESPQRAADIANAFGTAVVINRTQTARTRLSQAIGQVQRQLDSLATNDKDGRRQLSQQLQRFRALRAAQGANATVIEPAVAPASAISPRPLRAAGIAVIIAILLGLGLVALAQSLDRRVRDPQEVESLTQRPLLAAIPRTAFEAPAGHATVEAFDMLRASLTYFHSGPRITSVLITSPQQGDGKTTVAVNLAIAMARSGEDVILLDSDLRRPRVARALSLSGRLGLTSVLVGTSSLSEALVEVPTATGGGRLRVLPAGPPPANRSRLVSSARMRDLLVHLQSQGSIVVIDSGPLLAVSDPIPLLDQVSGVVLVARMDTTTREALRRATQLFDSTGATVLGGVATGVSTRNLYAYYDYSADPPAALNGGKNGRPAPLAPDGTPALPAPAPPAPPAVAVPPVPPAAASPPKVADVPPAAVSSAPGPQPPQATVEDAGHPPAPQEPVQQNRFEQDPAAPLPPQATNRPGGTLPHVSNPQDQAPQQQGSARGGLKGRFRKGLKS